MYVIFGEGMVTKSVFTKATGVPGRQSHGFQINHLRELQLRLSLRIRESVQSSVLQIGSNTKQGLREKSRLSIVDASTIAFFKSWPQTGCNVHPCFRKIRCLASLFVLSPAAKVQSPIKNQSECRSSES